AAPGAAGVGGRGQPWWGRQTGHGVAVDEAAVLSTQDRQWSSVDLGLVVGRDRQGHGTNGQGPVDERDGVVARRQAGGRGGGGGVRGRGLAAVAVVVSVSVPPSGAGVSPLTKPP